MGKMKQASRKKTMRLFANLSYFIIFLTTVGYAQEGILIIRNSGKAFEETVQGLKDDIDADLSIKEIILQNEAPMRDFSKALITNQPAILVLMDNLAINTYKRLLQEPTNSFQEIPSVSLMAIYLDKVIEGLTNATGIRYEIPAVVSGVNLRSISSKSIKKIGVVYREIMSDFFEENVELCKQEELELVGVRLSNSLKGKNDQIRKALKKLSVNEKVDALWILNDNVLLNHNLLKEVWLPELPKYKIPKIVGVEILVSSRLDFGTFAVLPDHYALGKQAAELIYDILENGDSPSPRPIEQPLSVVNILNMKQAKKVLKLDKSKLANIDKIVE